MKNDGMARFAAPGLMMAASIATLSVFVVFNLDGPAGNQFTATLPQQLLLCGRLAGILGALLFLFQFLLMDRKRFAGDPVGKARMVKTHGIIGFSFLCLLAVHVVLVFLGKSMLSGESFHVALGRFLGDGGWGSFVLLGFSAILVVLICCGLMVAGKIPLTFWRRTHFLIYAAVIPILGHQNIRNTQLEVKSKP